MFFCVPVHIFQCCFILLVLTIDNFHWVGPLCALEAIVKKHKDKSTGDLGVAEVPTPMRRLRTKTCYLVAWGCSPNPAGITEQNLVFRIHNMELIIMLLLHWYGPQPLDSSGQPNPLSSEVWRIHLHPLHQEPMKSPAERRPVAPSH